MLWSPSGNDPVGQRNGLKKEYSHMTLLKELKKITWRFKKLFANFWWDISRNTCNYILLHTKAGYEAHEGWKFRTKINSNLEIPGNWEVHGRSKIFNCYFSTGEIAVENIIFETWKICNISSPVGHTLSDKICRRVRNSNMMADQNEWIYMPDFICITPHIGRYLSDLVCTD